MDPKEFPILSHLLSQIDQSSNPPNPEVERIALTQFPHLNNPKVASLLTQVIPTSLTQTHALLRALGPRPDPDVVSTARSRMTQVQELGGAGGGGGGGREEEKEVEIYRAAVRLEGIYEEHERQLRDVEERLVGAYREVVAREIEGSQVNEEVVAVLKEAQSGGVVERLDLSGRQLTLIPEAFGTLHGLFLLNLSHNQLQVLPDSIAGLELLEQLDISSNMLELLPDSIGLLRKLKVLNVSGNKLKALPESIALCSSLVELDASFNNLMSLPKNIGYGLMNLERLSIQLNKICFLPQSICEMKSLRYLDAHFNELHGLPHAIGRLITLEVLNVSSNFSDFTELPETIGDLTNLRELDLSNNQIRVLPYSFCRLQNLSKLNLDENPLIVPPKDVVNKGIEALREFMAKAWRDMIADEQQRSMQDANQQQPQSKWLGWGASWLNNLVTGVSQGISGYLGGEKAPRDPYLDQLL